MRINVINRIVVAVTVQVQTIDRIWIQVGGIVGADESAPLRVIIPGIQVVQPRLPVIVIAAITNGVGLCLYFTTFPTGSQEKGWPTFADQPIFTQLTYARSLVTSLT